MMRAMHASSPDPASLICESVPVPDPGPGELLVEVHATAVTAGELTWPESWPAIPCHDLSGVVAATGSGVTGWRSGDEVYGLVGFDRPGAAAEYVTAPAADLAVKPAGSRITSVTPTSWSTWSAVRSWPVRGRCCAAAEPWSPSLRSPAKTTADAMTSAACTSSSNPMAVSSANWPRWSAVSGCA